MSATITRRSLLRATPALAAAGVALAPLPRLAVAAEPAAATTGSIRLAANENPNGPSETAREAIRATLPEAWKYPYAEEMELRKLIAAREGVSPQHVMIGDGSTEVLRVAALANGLEHGEVVTTACTFAMVREYSEALGAPVQALPLDADMRFDLAAIRARMTPATRLVYLCNPNNPTGTRLPGASVRDFVASAPKEVLVIVDEAYLDLHEDFLDHTALPRVIAGDNVLVTRTFSKLHGMAGLRIGYGLARPDIIKRLERLRISMLSLVGLRAALASYQDLNFQAYSRKALREARTITDAVLDELKLRHTDSQANFVFFDTGRPFAEFSQAMQKRGIQIGRPFPPYTTWARVSMGTVENMRAFAAAAREHFRAS
jgi:histidinol-phosphate aminotransferase